MLCEMMSTQIELKILCNGENYLDDMMRAYDAIINLNTCRVA